MPPRLLIDSFYSQRQYPLHTLSASENTDDAVLVGAARRTTYDAWKSVTTNTDAWVKSRNDVPRYADMVVVDRGHNQGGKTVKVQLSGDDFTTTQDVFNSITPSSAGAGALNDALGVRTWEGAWLKQFTANAGYDWRYFIPALGAGLVATVPGLWIGLSWSPGDARLPFAPDIAELIVQEMESDEGWTGRGKTTARRSGVLHFRFASLFDADLAMQHVQHYVRGRPMWIIPDEDNAVEAFLAVMPRERVGIEYPVEAWKYPKLSLPYREADPSGD